MKELDKKTMMKLSGGGISGWTLFGIGSFFSFLAGVIDGFTRPLKCH